jgi:DNA-binding LytR/AlgR family response regulator
MQALSAVRDLERYQVDTATWEPWTWELTSAVALLTLLPGLVRLVAFRPWSSGRQSVTALLYAAAAVVFSAAHVALMVALRKAVYVLAGSRYVFGSVGREFVYELRKDAVTFLLLLIVLNLLREVERRLTAPVLVEREVVAPEVAVAVAAAASAAPPDSMITIRDGTKEVRLARELLVALRAAGNYVEVFLATDRPLMIRATLADAELRLGDAGFVRVHRSWLVAVDHVRALTPTGAGDYRAELSANLSAPISRRYKEALGRLRGAVGTGGAGTPKDG